MAVQQGLRQASVRAATGTGLSYNGDWAALFDLTGIPAGGWNGRFLTWLNTVLGAAYTNVNGAMAAFAAVYGAKPFDAVGTFTAGIGVGSFLLASNPEWEASDQTSLFVAPSQALKLAAASGNITL